MNEERNDEFLCASKALKKKLSQDFMKRKNKLLQKIAIHNAKKEGIKKDKEIYKKRVNELKLLKERSPGKDGVAWDHVEEDEKKINEKMKEVLCEKGYIAAMVENMKREKEMI